MKFVINGAPCCGKTTFGNWLQDNHGYRHINFEDGNGTVHLEELRIGLKGAAPAPWAGKVVVTWAFVPNPHNFDIIGTLVSYGFTAWRFDGDRGLARERSIVRDGPSSLLQFDAQAAHLTNAREEIARFYGVRVITTLTPAGCLLCPEILAAVSK